MCDTHSDLLILRDHTVAIAHLVELRIADVLRTCTVDDGHVAQHNNY